jgi:hypothetical protein
MRMLSVFGHISAPPLMAGRWRQRGCGSSSILAYAPKTPAESALYRIVDLPVEHPMFSILYRVNPLPQIPSLGSWQLTRQDSEIGAFNRALTVCSTTTTDCSCSGDVGARVRVAHSRARGSGATSRPWA